MFASFVSCASIQRVEESKRGSKLMPYVTQDTAQKFTVRYKRNQQQVELPRRLLESPLGTSGCKRLNIGKRASLSGGSPSSRGYPNDLLVIPAIA